MEITKGLLLRCEFELEKGGAFKKWPLKLMLDENNMVESVWIGGQYLGSCSNPDFKRIQSLWYGLTGERLKPAD